MKSAAQRAARFQVAAPVRACRSENCARRTPLCLADVEAVRLSRGALPIRATVLALILATGARSPDITPSVFDPARKPTNAPRSNVDCRCCASENSPSSIARPRAQSCDSLLRRRSSRAVGYAIARLMAQATSLPVTKPCASRPLGSTMYLLPSRL